MVRGSEEGTLNELLEQEEEKLTRVARHEQNGALQGYHSGNYDQARGQRCGCPVCAGRVKARHPG